MDTPKPEEKKEEPKVGRELVMEVHAGHMKEIISIISILDDGDFKLRTSKDWISYQSVDPSHVVMASFQIPTIKMKTWKKDATLILNAKKMNHILRSTKAKSYGSVKDGTFGYDKVKIYTKVVKHGDVTDPKAPPIEVNKPIIQVETEVGLMTIHMPAIDGSGITDPKLPDLKLTASVTLETDALRRALHLCAGFSDHVGFVLEPDKDDKKCKFTLTVGDSLSLQLKSEYDERIQVVLNHVVYNKKPQQSIRSLYPLDYLESMLKVIKSKTVTIMFANDYPCQVNYLIDGSFDAFFLLAPRIENV